jgi:hypothetical protein
LEAILLYILYGEDDFSLKEALAEIKEGLGDKELLATNTTLLQGQNLTLQQLIITCDTLPFLTPKRLVIVDGLLSRIDPQDKERHAPKPRIPAGKHSENTLTACRRVRYWYWSTAN